MVVSWHFALHTYWLYVSEQHTAITLMLTEMVQVNSDMMRWKTCAIYIKEVFDAIWPITDMEVWKR